MKFLAILLIFLTFVSSYAQLPQGATLFDEFSDIHCDELLARIDYFSIRLANDPTTNGVAVVSGSNEHLLRKLILELKFKSNTARPGSGHKRIPVVRGEESGQPKLSFFLIPTKVAIPQGQTWDLTIPSGTKRSAFHVNFDNICSYWALESTISELLESNPRLRVNVVLSAWKPRDFSKLEREVKQSFTSNELRKMRFFRTRSEYPDSTGDNAEYWLVP